MLLSARFKSAWAFHQLLVGMQRIATATDFENKSPAFQSLLGRLKRTTEDINGPQGVSEEVRREIVSLEEEVEKLLACLESQELRIAPSVMRQFLDQVRTLDERILIEVVHFYLEIQRDRPWEKDRIDKVDLLLSRLAEKVAGPGLQGDRARLKKVLQALLVSASSVEIGGDELEALSGTLQDLRTEIRWVKSFGELKESRLVEIYRALKHDLGERIFHPKLLAMIVEVDCAFRQKIDELRNLEESHILDEYRQLSQLHQETLPEADTARSQLEDLHRRIDRFRQHTRAGNVRLDELEELGETVRSMVRRFQHGLSRPASPLGSRPGVAVWIDGSKAERMALVPDLELLQPHWSQLLAALSGLSAGLTAEEASSESSLAAYRLEPREVEAFRSHSRGGEDPCGVEQFVLAAAALRRRICKDVEELRDLPSRDPGAVPHLNLQQSRETARIADAYVKHFSHLIEQAVLDRRAEEAGSLQHLQQRLMRDHSGLMILMSRFGPTAPGPDLAANAAEKQAVATVELATEASDPFGKLGGERDLD